MTKVKVKPNYWSAWDSYKAYGWLICKGYDLNTHVIDYYTFKQFKERKYQLRSFTDE